jgi:hypothetical protein
MSNLPVLSVDFSMDIDYIFKNNVSVDPNLISRPSSPPVKTT